METTQVSSPANVLFFEERKVKYDDSTFYSSSPKVAES
jgi:hypothetical protein